LGFNAQNPTGYGRLLVDPNNGLLAIREEADASEEEKAIRLCNSGVMAFDGALLAGLIDSLDNKNAKGEYYLTDTVKTAHDSGRPVLVVECDESEVLGVNSREQLAAAEAVIQQRLRKEALAGGATLIIPETVYFSHDTKLGRDVTVEPNVFFGEGVEVGDNVHIKAFCHLEGTILEDGAEIGPHARLRPGTRIGQGAKIGNFVEVKNTDFGAGAKANHLSYVGDSTVGEMANIGAGTITCNYDGFKKSKTHIGANAFIGSNSSLVAPVSIGAGAYVGSSSVITRDVPEDALALTRAAHKEISGWASRRASQGTDKKKTSK
ncbi:MAG: DapH/DapD/GlmU-related protein, partial [Hyphomicrobiales bacterium]